MADGRQQLTRVILLFHRSGLPDALTNEYILLYLFMHDHNRLEESKIESKGEEKACKRSCGLLHVSQLGPKYCYLEAPLIFVRQHSDRVSIFLSLPRNIQKFVVWMDDKFALRPSPLESVSTDEGNRVRYSIAELQLEQSPQRDRILVELQVVDESGSLICYHKMVSHPHVETPPPCSGSSTE